MLIALALLVVLGTVLFLIHRAYQRRKGRLEEDEEALQKLSSGQQERPPPPPSQHQPPGAPLSIVPSSGQPPAGYPPGYDPQYDPGMASSMRDDQRRQQDMAFRAYQQQQQMQGVASGPEFRGGSPPMSPGMLPNLGVNPAAAPSSLGFDGQPVPGSPADMGYDPI